MPKLLSSITSTGSGSATGSWANIPNMTSGSVTVTAGSALLILLQVPFVAQDANATPEFRIEIDGTWDGSDGALGFSQTGTDEVKHGCLAFIATGYSGSTTFAAEWIARLGDCDLDTGRERTFQVIEFLDGEFDLLVDIQLSSFDTAPVTWDTLLGFTGTPTVGSADSVNLMITNFVTWGIASDTTTEAMFAVDGTREGPQQNIVFVDNTNMLSHGLLTHAVSGLSGSTTFSLEWLRIQGAATLDTAKQRNFQVIELKSTTLQTDVQVQTSQSSPATWADMTSMTGTYTPASSDSVNIMACNPVIALDGGDKGADARFADGGSREGPLLTPMFTDNTDEGSSGAMMWAKTGVTGSKTFSFQWQDRVGDPNLDTGRDRSFFLLECIAAVGDVEVEAITDALVLTEYTATIKADIEVDATVDALTLTEYAADVNLDVDVDATTDALTLTEYAADVDLDVNVVATTDALTLTEYAATIKADIEVDATTDTLILTEYAATIQADIEVDATVDALTLTEYAATVDVTADIEVDATTDALTLTEYTAIVDITVNVTATTDALTLTEYAATIKVDTNILANTDALILTEYTASVNVVIDIVATTDALTLTEYAADVDLDVNVVATTDALTLTEYAADVQAEGEILVEATTDALILTEYAASVNVIIDVAATVDELILTEYAADIELWMDAVILGTDTVTGDYVNIVGRIKFP